MPNPRQSRSAQSVEHLSWPPISTNSGPALASMVEHLEQTQWWSLSRIQEHQLLQIKELLKYAKQNIPFYKTNAAYPEPDKIEELSLSTFKSLPVISRKDIVEAGTEIVNRDPPRSHGQLLRGRTTGSSGRPLEYYGTQLTKLFWEAFTIREHLWHQRDFKGKLAVIRFGVSDSENNSWGPPSSLLYQTGPSVALNIKTDISEQVAWLVKHGPDYLLSFPSNIRALAIVAAEKNIDLSNLKEIRSVSEAVSPELRTIVSNSFQAKLVDVYSTCETGYVALQCPETDNYHIQSEGSFVEILDDKDLPCAPGETGRVVVTDLHNFAMPLIRYDLGDFATVGSECSCGRGLPVITRINGRERNLVKLPDGKTYWPLIGYHSWMGVAPIEQIQLEQTSLKNIKVNLVAPRQMTPDEKSTFESILVEALGYPFDFAYNYTDTILTGPGGKFEDFICRI